MERVNHIDIVEVGGSGLIGYVDRVTEREIPHGEGLKFGIARFDASLVLVEKLAQTHGHLAAAGAGGCDDDKRLGSLNIIVAAEALVRCYEADIGRVAVDDVMYIAFDAHALEACAESVGTCLAVVVGDDDGVDRKAALLKLAAQSEGIHVVGDTEVLTYLVLLDIDRTDDDYDFRMVGQLAEHAQLAVGLKPGEHAARVVVVK